MKFSMKTLPYVKKFSYFETTKLVKIARTQLSKISRTSEISKIARTQLAKISENPVNQN